MGKQSSGNHPPGATGGDNSGGQMRWWHIAVGIVLLLVLIILANALAKTSYEDNVGTVPTTSSDVTSMTVLQIRHIMLQNAAANDLIARIVER